MGMFDNVYITAGFTYSGKKYVYGQTKALDCQMDAIRFGEKVPSEYIPPSGYFSFCAFAEKDEKDYYALFKSRREGSLNIPKAQFDEYVKQYDKRKLIEFRGYLNKDRVFYKICSWRGDRLTKKTKTISDIQFKGDYTPRKIESHEEYYKRLKVMTNSSEFKKRWAARMAKWFTLSKKETKIKAVCSFLEKLKNIEGLIRQFREKKLFSSKYFSWIKDFKIDNWLR